MVKKIGIAVAVIVVAFLGFVATRPAQFHIERSAAIPAPADVVFEQVSVMKNRHAWYPWDKLDPNMKLTYSGPDSGVGAHYEWAGNKDVGSGEQTTIESVPNAKIVDDLKFKEPFPAHNKSTFTFVSEGASTKVTWSMDGDNGFMAKLAGVFMDMDAMIGKDFEAGLKTLSEIAVTAHNKKATEEAAKKAEEEAAKAQATDPAKAAAPAPAAGEAAQPGKPG